MTKENKWKTHIRALRNFLNIENLSIFRSYIVFSERCELKKIILDDKNIKVIKRHQLKETLARDYKLYGKVLTEKEIDLIYNKLYKYMFVDNEQKIGHINYINELKKQKINKRCNNLCCLKRLVLNIITSLFLF